MTWPDLETFEQKIAKLGLWNWNVARRFPVVTVDEFRTTKLCFDCGRPLSHPRRHHRPIEGSCFCFLTDDVHCDAARRLLHRDADAARKIGHRFVMQLCGESIGNWSRGSSDAEAFYGMRQWSDGHLQNFCCAPHGDNVRYHDSSVSASC